MEVVLLHNENAGDESWSRKDLMRLVRAAGFAPKYCSLKRALDEPELLQGGAFAIVAGGDGSLRKAALALLGRGCPIAPLPLGTANNIARSFGLAMNPQKIVEGWRTPARQAVDVGMIEGPWGKRHFIEGVGLGLISRAITFLEEIDSVASFALKKPKHKLHRDLCVVTALAHEMQPIRAHVVLDQRDCPDEFLLLEVLNIRRAGPGLELAPFATPSDGRFDVVTATARQRPRLMRLLKAQMEAGKPVPSLTIRRARRVRLGAHSACDIRIDDRTERVDAGTIMEITIVRGALEFVLPGGR